MLCTRSACRGRIEWGPSAGTQPKHWTCVGESSTGGESRRSLPKVRREQMEALCISPQTCSLLVHEETAIVKLAWVETQSHKTSCRVGRKSGANQTKTRRESIVAKIGGKRVRTAHSKVTRITRIGHLRHQPAKNGKMVYLVVDEDSRYPCRLRILASALHYVLFSFLLYRRYHGIVLHTMVLPVRITRQDQGWGPCRQMHYPFPLTPARRLSAAIIVVSGLHYGWRYRMARVANINVSHLVLNLVILLLA